jgi:hypothetical protein
MVPGARFPTLVVGAALAFLALYSVFVAVLPPNPEDGQDQFQENEIRVQEFVYQKGSMDAVILGSSMGARIPVAGSRHRLFNISLAGGTAATGAEILHRSGLVPKVVFVEASTVILRDVDDSFLDGVFHPVAFPLRKWIPALRESQQPVSRLNQVVKQFFGRGRDRDAEVPPELYEFQVQTSARDFASRSKPADRLGEKIRSLGERLDELHAQGARVVLFELPVDPRLTDLPLAVEVRQAFRERFPAEKYEWLEIPETRSLETVDGIHLKKASALRMGALLDNALDTPRL